MGINYYARPYPCQSCGKSAYEKHIGKSSIGWKFLFKAYHDIRSWKDWQQEILNGNIAIYDEDGQNITLKELRKIVENRIPAVCRRDYTNSMEIWIDPEGYEFTDEEFS